jgi:ABC-type antimicrobial peptide transport system permease subunit
MGPVATAAFLSRPVPLGIVTSVPEAIIPALLLSGSITVADGQTNEAYAAGVQIWGVESQGAALIGLPGGAELWDGDQRQAVVGRRLAERLTVSPGSRLVVSVQRWSTLPRGILFARRSLDDTTTTATVILTTIAPPETTADDFALTPQMAPPLNIYVPLRALWQLVADDDSAATPHANLLLSTEPDAERLTNRWRQTLRLVDYGLYLRPAYQSSGWFWWQTRGYTSVESDSLILAERLQNIILQAAHDIGVDARPTLVYLAQSITYQHREIPYAVVAGVDPDAPPPLGPFHTFSGRTIRDDEIALLDWDESPLKDLPQNQPVDLVMTYYHPEVEGEGRLEQTTLRFCGYLPASGAAHDRYLTPLVKGITDQGAHPRDWDRPPQLTNAKVREKIRAGDVHDRFWQRFGPTPKAFVNLVTARRLFGSRYGVATSVRVATTDVARLQQALLARLDPYAVGLNFQLLPSPAAQASGGARMFTGLFLAFSSFLIGASLLLIILISRLAVERRVHEIGIWFAVGFRPHHILYVLLGETAIITIIGSIVGLLISLLYCRSVLYLFATVWPSGNLHRIIQEHVTVASLVEGFSGTLLLGWISQWWAIRALVHIPVPALLGGETEITYSTGPTHRYMWWMTVVIGLVGAGLLGWWGTSRPSPEDAAMSFFGAGFLVLAAGLAAWYGVGLHSSWLPVRGIGWRGRWRLSWRSLARRRNRSLLTAGLLAAAVFLLTATESFRRTPETNVWDRSSGSGGFNLVGECTIPLHDPITEGPGRDALEARLQAAYGGSSTEPRFQHALELLQRVEIVSLRLRSGDDVSCANLYQAQRPRVVGVPDRFIDRGGFRFSHTLATTPEERANPWLLLRRRQADGALPIICEQDTAQWKFLTDVGGVLTLTGEDGTSFRCRIVATLINSPFTSELVMADSVFGQLFPSIDGYRFLLIHTQPQDEATAQQVLELGLRAQGLRIVRTVERLQQAAEIVGAYLTTFQLLGALGLLLGLGGVAVLIARSLWERISEWALLRAVGFGLDHIRQLVIVENLLLFSVGLSLGVVAAAVAVLPHWQRGAPFPWLKIAALLVAVFFCGWLVIVWTSKEVLRLPLLAALRNQ